MNKRETTILRQENSCSRSIRFKTRLSMKFHNSTLIQEFTPYKAQATNIKIKKTQVRQDIRLKTTMKHKIIIQMKLLKPNLFAKNRPQSVFSQIFQKYKFTLALLLHDSNKQYEQQILIEMIKTFCNISSKYTLLSIKYCSSVNLKSHYELLQIDSSATFKQIKDKYILKSKMYHPDISPNSSDVYQEIQSAYKILSLPQTRKRYDLSLGIQYSLWEKQLLGQKFNVQFQMEELYNQILKPQNQHKKDSATLSAEQHLQKEFQNEIINFEAKKIFKSFGFISLVIGISIFWFVWSGVQIFYLNYTGKTTHKIQKMHTETTLKIIPLVSR